MCVAGLDGRTVAALPLRLQPPAKVRALVEFVVGSSR
jgi:hypothetical protein